MAEQLSGVIERVTFHNPDTGFAVLRVQARGRRGLVTVVGDRAVGHGRRVRRGDRRLGAGPRARRAVQGRRAALHAAAHRSRASKSTSAPAWSRASARTSPARSSRSSASAPWPSSTKARRSSRRSRASARAASSASARAGSSRRPSATSWSSCSRTASARPGPSASTRPTATRPSRWCAPTRTGWPPTSGASASRRPTTWPAPRHRPALAAARPRRPALRPAAAQPGGPRRLSRSRRRSSRPAGRDGRRHRHSRRDHGRRGRGGTTGRRRGARAGRRASRWLYLKPLFLAELGVARALHRLARGRPPACRRRWTSDGSRAAPSRRKMGLELAAAQRDAIRQATREKVLVVTGGPGVGKTTIVRGILEIFAGRGLRCRPVRPTGRAAKRLTRDDRPRGEDHSSPAGVRPGPGRLQARRQPTRSTSTCSSWTRRRWWTWC